MASRTWKTGGAKDIRIDDKIVVITGSNTGIGKETAKDLAKRGGHIIMACRNVKKTEDAAEEIKKEVPDAKLTVVELDLSSFQSIRECAKKILETVPNIHILINNAGVMMCPYSETKEGHELQFGTNHLGHFLFTNLLLDRIKASAPARIVVVSSVGHQLGAKMHWDDLNMKNNYGPWKSYAQSKLANVLFAKELAEKLKGTGVTTYVLHPGAVNTELARHVDDAGVFQKMFTSLSRKFMKTPVQGAQTTLYCALAEEIANDSGLYYSDSKEKGPSRRALNKEDAKKLWDVSVALTNVG